MSDYIPTTDNVRHAYADFHYPVESVSHAIGLVEFDDWLAQVRAEARRDALRAEADALERYTHMFTPDGGVYLSNIVRLIRRDAEFALADKETP